MSIINLPFSEINVNMHMPSLATATQHTSERKATHKHDTTVIKLQINKCFTSIFELYLTDSFQREIIHSSSGCESGKNKIIDMNIN